MRGALRGQENELYPLQMVSKAAVNHLTWGLRSKVRSSGRIQINAFKKQFNVYRYLPACVFVHYMHTWYLWRPEESDGFPGVTNSCKLRYRCWEQISGPLKGQPRSHLSSPRICTLINRYLMDLMDLAHQVRVLVNKSNNLTLVHRPHMVEVETE